MHSPLTCETDISKKMARFKSYSEILETGYKEQAVVLSRDLKVLYANDSYLQANGLKLSDIEGKPCHDVLNSCMGFCKELTEECPVHEALTTGKPVQPFSFRISATFFIVVSSDTVTTGKIGLFQSTSCQ